MEEEWVNIVGFDQYMVSNYGDVYSWVTNRILRPDVMTKGYLRVYLYRNRVRVGKLIHVLVAESFVPGWDYDLEVNHIDGYKANNIETNLEWVTSQGNTEHAIALGLHRVGRPVRVLGDSYIYDNIKLCANELGIHPQRISEILNGTRYDYQGWRFEYAA